MGEVGEDHTIRSARVEAVRGVGTSCELGQIYFSVQFGDEDLLVPILEPLEFVGTNLHAGDVNQLYFRSLGLPTTEFAPGLERDDTEPGS